MQATYGSFDRISYKEFDRQLKPQSLYKVQINNFFHQMGRAFLIMISRLGVNLQVLYF